MYRHPGLGERVDDDRRGLLVGRGVGEVVGERRGGLAGLGDELPGELRVTGVGDAGRMSVHIPVGGIVGPDVRLERHAVGVLAGEGAAVVQADRGPVQGNRHGLADLDVLDLVDVDPVVLGVGVEAADRATLEVGVRGLRVLKTTDRFSGWTLP